MTEAPRLPHPCAKCGRVFEEIARWNASHAPSVDFRLDELLAFHDGLKLVAHAQGLGDEPVRDYLVHEGYLEVHRCADCACDLEIFLGMVGGYLDCKQSADGGRVTESGPYEGGLRHGEHTIFVYDAKKRVHVGAAIETWDHGRLVSVRRI